MQYFKNGGVITILNTNQEQGHLKERHSLFYASALFRAGLIDSLRKSTDPAIKFLVVHNNLEGMKREELR